MKTTTTSRQISHITVWSLKLFVWLQQTRTQWLVTACNIRKWTRDTCLMSCSSSGHHHWSPVSHVTVFMSRCTLSQSCDFLPLWAHSGAHYCQTLIRPGDLLVGIVQVTDISPIFHFWPESIDNSAPTMTFYTDKYLSYSFWEAVFSKSNIWRLKSLNKGLRESFYSLSLVWTPASPVLLV